MNIHKFKRNFIIVVAILIVLPIFKFNYIKGYNSDLDNRKLVDFPSFNKTFLSKLSTYVSDRIGFRERMLQTYIDMNDTIFGELVHPRYQYGRDGYTFLKIQRNENDDAFLDSFALMIKKIQTYCEERNVPFVYVFNPDKKEVYSDKLPEGYLYSNERVQFFIQKLNEYDVNYVDNTALMKSKKEEQIYNIEYDAGHWNALGAFYGINATLENLNTQNSQIEQNKKTDFEIEEVLQREQMNSNLIIDETVPAFKPKKEIITRLKYKEELKFNPAYRVYIHTLNLDENTNGMRLLSLQGSYFNNFPQFLESQFKEYIAIHNYENMMNFDYYFNVFKPDCVIIESAEYATNKNYFNLNAIYNVNLNPIISKWNNLEEQYMGDISDSKYEILTALVNCEIPVNIEEGDYVYLMVDEEVYDAKINIYDKNVIVTFDKSYHADINQMQLVVIPKNQEIKRVYTLTEFPY